MTDIINYGIRYAKDFKGYGPTFTHNIAVMGVGRTSELAYQEAKRIAQKLCSSLKLPETNTLDPQPDEADWGNGWVYCVEIRFNIPYEE